MRQGNKAFRKRSSNKNILELTAFGFCVDTQHFENGELISPYNVFSE